MSTASAIRAGRAFVELFADDSQLVRGLRAAERKVVQFGQNIKAIGQRIMLTGVAVGAGIAAITKSFVSWGDSLAKMSARTGVAITALSELAYAAQQSGTDVATLESSLRTMQRNLAGAFRGNKTAIATLESLGISVENLQKLSPEQQFLVLGEAISRITDPTNRVAMAMRIFGKSGTQLLPMFADGASGIELMRNRARELGLTVSDLDAKNAEKLSTAFSDLWYTIKATGFTIGAALAEPLLDLVEKVTCVTAGIAKWLDKNRELAISATKITAAVIAVGAALVVAGLGFTVLGKSIGLVAFSLASLGKTALGTFGIFSGVFKAVAVVAGTLGTIFSGVAATLGGVFSAITSVGSGLLSVLGGITSVFVSIISGAIGAIFSITTGIFGGVTAIFGAVVSGALTVVPVILSAFAGIATGITAALGTIFSVLGSALAPLFSLVTTALSPLVTACTGVFSMIVGAAISAAGTIIAAITPAFTAVATMVAATCSTIVSTIFGAFSAAGIAIISFLTPIFSAVVGVCSSALAAVATTIGTAFMSIGPILATLLSTALSAFAAALVPVVAGVGAAVASLLGAVGSIVAGILASMSPVIVVLLAVGAAACAAFFAVKSFLSFLPTIGTLFQKVIGVVGNCLASLVGVVISFGGYVAGKFLDCFLGIATGVASAFTQLGTVVFSAMKNVGSACATAAQYAVSGIFTAFSAAWEWLTATFSSVFSTLSGIIATFGNWFVVAFSQLGTAVNWFGEQFKNLSSFVTETFGAISAAIGRGDIEAAVQILWASLKLIWVQGSNWLLSTWYYVVDTLQSAWASCVYKLSEILTGAWYGVQEFWIETVYTMSTVWTEFSNGVVSAWKTAEKTIAKGIGYLIAQMEGLDYSELAKTIDEDYSRQAKQREAAKSQKLSNIQSERDSKISSLATDKKGVLDTLKSDFENAAGVRDAAYQAKLAAQEQELAAAKAAYDEAIERAKNPQLAGENVQESLLDRLRTQMNDVMAGLSFDPQLNLDNSIGGLLESKITASGSFSAAEAQSMGVGSTMDRVAKASERSEKHLEKIAGKEEKPAIVQKKEVQQEAPQEDKNPMLAELKIHTRILRDLSTNGGVFV